MAEHPALSPRAVRTRSALIAAGFDLLVDRPIDAIPIDDFVAKAGVAKGSFFNHFRGKQAFAEAIATEVRLELENQIALANADVVDPVARIAGGMRIGAEFAINEPKRTLVLLRSHGSSTARDHPLNKGLVDDFKMASENGLLKPEAQETGMLYWMGLCQVLMSDLVERPMTRTQADRRISDMITLGLAGLGITPIPRKDSGM